MRIVVSILLLTALLLTGCPIAGAADDYKVIKLEQDVRNLERQVYNLTRQVDALRAAQPNSARGTAPPSRAERETASAPTDPPWLTAANWNRVRPGTAELDVIGALGAPTSMREEKGRRVLLYALEIGSSGFLSGSVALEDRVVVEVQRPVLK